MLAANFCNKLDQFDAEEVGRAFFGGLRHALPVKEQANVKVFLCALRNPNRQVTLGALNLLYNGNSLMAFSSIVRTLFNHAVVGSVALNGFNDAVVPSEKFIDHIYNLVPMNKRYQVERETHALVNDQLGDVGMLCTYWFCNEVLAQEVCLMPSPLDSGRVFQLVSEKFKGLTPG